MLTYEAKWKKILNFELNPMLMFPSPRSPIIRHGSVLRFTEAPGFPECCVALLMSTQQEGDSFIVAVLLSLAQVSYLAGHPADERSANVDPTGIASQYPAVMDGGLLQLGITLSLNNANIYWKVYAIRFNSNFCFT